MFLSAAADMSRYSQSAVMQTKETTWKAELERKPCREKLSVSQPERTKSFL